MQFVNPILGKRYVYIKKLNTAGGHHFSSNVDIPDSFQLLFVIVLLSYTFALAVLWRITVYWYFQCKAYFLITVL